MRGIVYKVVSGKISNERKCDNRRWLILSQHSVETQSETPEIVSETGFLE
jgi:hypothetical protein